MKEFHLELFVCAQNHTLLQVEGDERAVRLYVVIDGLKVQFRKKARNKIEPWHGSRGADRVQWMGNGKRRSGGVDAELGDYSRNGIR